MRAHSSRELLHLLTERPACLSCRTGPGSVVCFHLALSTQGCHKAWAALRLARAAAKCGHRPLTTNQQPCACGWGWSLLTVVCPVGPAVAVVGPICSSDAVAAAGVAALVQVPLISPAASSPQLSNLPYFFRTVPSDRCVGQGPGGADCTLRCCLGSASLRATQYVVLVSGWLNMCMRATCLSVRAMFTQQDSCDTPTYTCCIRGAL